MLFCIPAILISSRILKFNYSVFDAIALVLPAGMIFQRMGCFVAGCCYGTVTSAPWAVTYPAGTVPFLHHQQLNLIPAGAAESCGVHPVQLYELVLCGVSLIILLRVRNYFRADASLFLFSRVLYFLLRFVTEFFRDPAAHTIGGTSRGPLNDTQWIMLALIIGISSFILMRERKWKPRAHTNPPEWRFAWLIYACALVMFVQLSLNWFNPVELVILTLALDVLILVTLMKAYQAFIIPSLRYTMFFLMVIVVIGMGQTYPEQIQSDSTLLSYNTLAIGYLTGKEMTTYIPTDCNGNPINDLKEKYKGTYHMSGIGLSRTMQTSRYQSFTFGANAYQGYYEERVVVHPQYPNNVILNARRVYGLNPYVQYDWKKFAFGAGLHTGDLTIAGIGDHYRAGPSKTFPQVYMRIGQLDIPFFELSVGNHFPSSFPATFYQAGIGFNHKQNYYRFGFSSLASLYASSRIQIKERFFLEPYIGIGVSDVDRGSLIGSINLRYQVNRKVKNKNAGLPHF
jgi:phosphatidylglycerol:prolipoprotein diacylglycerol transferase